MKVTRNAQRGSTARRMRMRKRRRRGLAAEKLEDRHLLAVPAFDETSGILTVDLRDEINAGSVTIDIAADDVVTASSESGAVTVPLESITRTVVFGTSQPDTISIFDARQLPASPLASLEISSEGGDDIITIDNLVATTVAVAAGAGNDVVDASTTSSPIVVDGGSGSDTILAGSGQNAIAELVGTDYTPASSETILSFAVTNANDSGPGSLRQAIIEANSAAGTAVIDFQLPAATVIQPQSQLPGLANPSHPIIVNGNTQTVFGGDSNPDGPEVILDGRLAGAGAIGLVSQTDGNRIVGVNIRNFGSMGVLVNGGAGTVIADNYIGTDETGTQAEPNGRGIWIQFARATAVTGNLVSGNATHGVTVRGFGHVVQGNRVGTTRDGQSQLGNGAIGISLLDATDSLIGGPNAEDANLVSGNQGKAGIRLQRRSYRNVVQGNHVGINSDGTAALANLEQGIELNSGPLDNEIRGNIIGGNGFSGIAVFSGTGSSTERNVFAANWVGLVPVPGGTPRRMPNLAGIAISHSTNNVIGGEAAEDANIIGANGRGISLVDERADGNLIVGNYVGTDSDGNMGLGNGTGISIAFRADNNTVRNNVISGNGTGVWLRGGEGAAVIGNVVQGNLVGIAPDGETPLPNSTSGIKIGEEAIDNVVGGVEPGEGNRIAYNDGPGVQVVGSGSTGNAIRGNSIHANRGQQIDLGNDGPTPDDPDDADSGPNQLQNSGRITALQTGAATQIAGTYSGAPDTAIRLDFYASTHIDPSMDVGGERYLGSVEVVTDSMGQTLFDVTLGTSTTALDHVTLTATGPDGSTSEFSDNWSAVSQFAVTSSDDAGPGSLREAILNVNRATQAAVIEFQLPPGSVIRPLSELPPLNNPEHPIVVDGTTQTSFAGDTNPLGPEVVLDGSLSTPGANGLIVTSEGVQIHGLNIRNFEGNGIWVNGGRDTLIADNYIGTDESGMTANGNGGSGIYLAGFGSLGAVTIRNNLVSGNAGHGLYVRGPDHMIEANRIGTTADGMRALANGRSGILLLSASNSVVGGGSNSQRNLISGNAGSGILQQSNSRGNLIQNNLVGLNADVSAVLGNGEGGIRLGNETHGSEIRGNVISGHTNGHAGIALFAGGGATMEDNIIAGNWLGIVPVPGEAPRVFGNSVGIAAGSGAVNNTIGGDSPNDANVIGGNGYGIRILDRSNANTVIGNYIGTDSRGQIFTNSWGIQIAEGASSNAVRDNVISGNVHGIEIRGRADRFSSSNVIQGNLIGVAPDGASAQPNQRAGILIGGYATGTLIGGTESGEANTIAFNGEEGVSIIDDTSTGHTIRGNSIHSNGGIEIDLGGDGVTPADADDADAGPNQLQNSAEVTSVETGPTTFVSGVYRGAANTIITLDFYASSEMDPSGYGGGERYLTSLGLVTDEVGYREFQIGIETATNEGEHVSVTVTGPDGSTSEFSNALAFPTAPQEVAEHWNVGIDAVAASLRAWASNFNLPFDVPALPNDFTSLFGLGGRGGAFDQFADASFATIDSLVSNSFAQLVDQIEALDGFRVECVLGINPCEDGAALGVRFDRELTGLSADANFAPATLGLLSGLTDSAELDGTTSLEATAEFSLAFGIDQDGFYLGGGSFAELQIVGETDLNVTAELPFLDLGVVAGSESTAWFDLSAAAGLGDAAERRRALDGLIDLDALDVSLNGTSAVDLQLFLTSGGEVHPTRFDAHWRIPVVDSTLAAIDSTITAPTPAEFAGLLISTLGDGLRSSLSLPLQEQFANLSLPLAQETISQEPTLAAPIRQILDDLSLHFDGVAGTATPGVHLTQLLEDAGFTVEGLVGEADLLSLLAGTPLTESPIEVSYELAPEDATVPLEIGFQLDLAELGGLADLVDLDGAMPAALRPDVELRFGVDDAGFFLDSSSSIGAEVVGLPQASGSFGPFLAELLGVVTIHPVFSLGTSGKLRLNDLSELLADNRISFGNPTAEVSVILTNELLDYVDVDDDATNNTVHGGDPFRLEASTSLTSATIDATGGADYVWDRIQLGDEFTSEHLIENFRQLSRAIIRGDRTTFSSELLSALGVESLPLVDTLDPNRSLADGLDVAGALANTLLDATEVLYVVPIADDATPNALNDSIEDWLNQGLPVGTQELIRLQVDLEQLQLHPNDDLTFDLSRILPDTANVFGRAGIENARLDGALVFGFDTSSAPFYLLATPDDLTPGRSTSVGGQLEAFVALEGEPLGQGLLELSGGTARMTPAFTLGFVGDEEGKLRIDEEPAASAGIDVTLTGDDFLDLMADSVIISPGPLTLSGVDDNDDDQLPGLSGRLNVRTGAIDAEVRRVVGSLDRVITLEAAPDSIGAVVLSYDPAGSSAKELLRISNLRGSLDALNVGGITPSFEIPSLTVRHDGTAAVPQIAVDFADGLADYIGLQGVLPMDVSRLTFDFHNPNNLGDFVLGVDGEFVFDSLPLPFDIAVTEGGQPIDGPFHVEIDVDSARRGILRPIDFGPLVIDLSNFAVPSPTGTEITLAGQLQVGRLDEHGIPQTLPGSDSQITGFFDVVAGDATFPVGGRIDVAGSIERFDRGAARWDLSGNAGLATGAGDAAARFELSIAGNRTADPPFFNVVVDAALREVILSDLVWDLSPAAIVSAQQVQFHAEAGPGSFGSQVADLIDLEVRLLPEGTDDEFARFTVDRAAGYDTSDDDRLSIDAFSISDAVASFDEIDVGELLKLEDLIIAIPSLSTRTGQLEGSIALSAFQADLLPGHSQFEAVGSLLRGAIDLNSGDVELHALRGEVSIGDSMRAVTNDLVVQFGPAQTAQDAVVAEIGRAIVDFPAYPQLPSAELTGITIRRNGFDVGDFTIEQVDTPAALNSQKPLPQYPGRIPDGNPLDPEIQGRVWLDTNGDGLQNSSGIDIDGDGDFGEAEAGVEGITVELYTVADQSAPGRVTTTDALGFYEFANVPAGDYRVRVDPGAGRQRFSPQVAGVSENIDSDVDESGVSGVITSGGLLGFDIDNQSDAGITYAVPRPVVILPGIIGTYAADILRDQEWLMRRGSHPRDLQEDPLLGGSDYFVQTSAFGPGVLGGQDFSGFLNAGETFQDEFSITNFFAGRPGINSLVEFEDLTLSGSNISVRIDPDGAVSIGGEIALDIASAALLPDGSTPELDGLATAGNLQGSLNLATGVLQLDADTAAVQVDGLVSLSAAPETIGGEAFPGLSLAIDPRNNSSDATIATVRNLNASIAALPNIPTDLLTVDLVTIRRNGFDLVTEMGGTGTDVRIGEGTPLLTATGLFIDADLSVTFGIGEEDLLPVVDVAGRLRVEASAATLLPDSPFSLAVSDDDLNDDVPALVGDLDLTNGELTLFADRLVGSTENLFHLNADDGVVHLRQSFAAGDSLLHVGQADVTVPLLGDSSVELTASDVEMFADGQVTFGSAAAAVDDGLATSVGLGGILPFDVTAVEIAGVDGDADGRLDPISLPSFSRAGQPVDLVVSGYFNFDSFAGIVPFEPAVQIGDEPRLPGPDHPFSVTFRKVGDSMVPWNTGTIRIAATSATSFEGLQLDGTLVLGGFVDGIWDSDLQGSNLHATLVTASGSVNVDVAVLAGSTLDVTTGRLNLLGQVEVDAGTSVNLGGVDFSGVTVPFTLTWDLNVGPPPTSTFAIEFNTLTIDSVTVEIVDILTLTASGIEYNPNAADDEPLGTVSELTIQLDALPGLEQASFTATSAQLYRNRLVIDSASFVLDGTVEFAGLDLLAVDDFVVTFDDISIGFVGDPLAGDPILVNDATDLIDSISVGLESGVLLPDDSVAHNFATVCTPGQPVAGLAVVCGLSGTYGTTGTLTVTTERLAADTLGIFQLEALGGSFTFGPNQAENDIVFSIPEASLWVPLSDEQTFELQTTGLQISRRGDVSLLSAGASIPGGFGQAVGLGGLLPLDVERVTIAGIDTNGDDVPDVPLRLNDPFSNTQFDVTVGGVVDLSPFDTLPISPTLVIGDGEDETFDVTFRYQNGQVLLWDVPRIELGIDVELEQQFGEGVVLGGAESSIFLGDEIDGLFNEGQFIGRLGGALTLSGGSGTPPGGGVFLSATLEVDGTIDVAELGDGTIVTTIDADFTGSGYGMLGDVLNIGTADSPANLGVNMAIRNTATPGAPFNLTTVCRENETEPCPLFRFLNFGTGEVSITLGDLVTLTGDAEVNFQAGPDEPMFILNSAGVTFGDQLGPLSGIGGTAGGFATNEARDQIFVMPGAFIELDLPSGQSGVKGSSFGLPEWLPIEVRSLGLKFNGLDLNNDGVPDPPEDLDALNLSFEDGNQPFAPLLDPGNFSLQISGGLQGTNELFPITAQVEKLEVDLGAIETLVQNIVASANGGDGGAGEFTAADVQPWQLFTAVSETTPLPITNLEAVNFGIEPIELGPLRIGGGIGFGMLNIDPDLEDGVDAEEPVFFARVEGELGVSNVGIGVELIVTQYGPVLARIFAGVPIPIGSIIGGLVGSAVPVLGSALGSSVGTQTGFLITGLEGGIVFGGDPLPTIDSPADIFSTPQIRNALEVNLSDIEDAVRPLVRDNPSLTELIENSGIALSQIGETPFPELFASYVTNVAGEFIDDEITVPSLIADVLSGRIPGLDLSFTWDKGFRVAISGVLTNQYVYGLIGAKVTLGANIGYDFDQMLHPNGSPLVEAEPDSHPRIPGVFYAVDENGTVLLEDGRPILYDAEGFRLSENLVRIDSEGNPINAVIDTGVEATLNAIDAFGLQIYGFADLDIAGFSLVGAGILLDYTELLSPKFSVAASLPGELGSLLSLLLPAQGDIGISLDTQGLYEAAPLAVIAALQTIIEQATEGAQQGADSVATFFFDALGRVANRFEANRRVAETLGLGQQPLLSNFEPDFTHPLWVKLLDRNRDGEVALDERQTVITRELLRDWLSETANTVIADGTGDQVVAIRRFSFAELGIDDLQLPDEFAPDPLDPLWMIFLDQDADGANTLLPADHRTIDLSFLAERLFGSDEVRSLLPGLDEFAAGEIGNPSDKLSFETYAPASLLNALQISNQLLPLLIGAGVEILAEEPEALDGVDLPALSIPRLEDSPLAGAAAAGLKVGQAFAQLFIGAGAEAFNTFFEVIDPEVRFVGRLQPTLFGFPIGEPQADVDARLNKNELTIQAQVALVERMAQYFGLPVTSQEVIDVHIPFDNLLRDLATGLPPAIDPLGNDMRVGLSSSVGLFGFQLAQVAGYLFPRDAKELLITGVRDTGTDELVESPILQVYFDPDHELYQADHPVHGNSGHPFSGVHETAAYDPSAPYESPLDLRRILVHGDKLSRLLGYEYDPIANNEAPADADPNAGGGLLIDGRLTLPKFITDPIAFAGMVAEDYTEIVGCGSDDFFQCIASHPLEVFNFLNNLAGVVGASDLVAQLQMFVPNFVDDVLAELNPAAIFSGLSQPLQRDIGELPSDASIDDLFALIQANAPSGEEFAAIVLGAIENAGDELQAALSDFYLVGSYGEVPAALDFPEVDIPTTSKILSIDIGGGEVFGEFDSNGNPSLKLKGTFLGLADVQFTLDSNGGFVGGTVPNQGLPRVGLEVGFGNTALLPDHAPQISASTTRQDFGTLLSAVGLEPSDLSSSTGGPGLAWLQVDPDTLAGYLRAYSPGFEWEDGVNPPEDPLKVRGGIEAFAQLAIPNFADHAEFLLQLTPASDPDIPDVIEQVVPDVNARVTIDSLNIPGLASLPASIFDADLELAFAKLSTDDATTIQAVASGAAAIFGGSRSLSGSLTLASDEGVYGYLQVGGENETFAAFNDAFAFQGDIGLLFNATSLDQREILVADGEGWSLDAYSGRLLLDGNLTIDGVTVEGTFELQGDGDGVSFVGSGGVRFGSFSELISGSTEMAVAGVLEFGQDGVFGGVVLQADAPALLTGAIAPATSGTIGLAVNSDSVVHSITLPLVEGHALELGDLAGYLSLDALSTRLFATGTIDLGGFDFGATLMAQSSSAGLDIYADGTLAVPHLSDTLAARGFARITPSGEVAASLNMDVATMVGNGYELSGSLSFAANMTGADVVIGVDEQVVSIPQGPGGSPYARLDVNNGNLELGAFAINNGAFGMTISGQDLRLGIAGDLRVLNQTLLTVPDAHLTIAPSGISGDVVLEVGDPGGAFRLPTFGTGVLPSHSYDIDGTFRLHIDSNPIQNGLAVDGTLSLDGISAEIAVAGVLDARGVGTLTVDAARLPVGPLGTPLELNASFELTRAARPFGRFTLFETDFRVVGGSLSWMGTSINLQNYFPIAPDGSFTARIERQVINLVPALGSNAMQLTVPEATFRAMPPSNTYSATVGPTTLTVPGLPELQLEGFDIDTGALDELLVDQSFDLGIFEFSGQLRLRSTADGNFQLTTGFLPDPDGGVSPPQVSVGNLFSAVVGLEVDTLGRFDARASVFGGTPDFGLRAVRIEDAQFRFRKTGTRLSSFVVEVDGGHLQLPLIDAPIDLPDLRISSSGVAFQAGRSSQAITLPSFELDGLAVSGGSFALNIDEPNDDLRLRVLSRPSINVLGSSMTLRSLLITSSGTVNGTVAGVFRPPNHSQELAYTTFRVSTHQTNPLFGALVYRLTVNSGIPLNNGFIDTSLRGYIQSDGAFSLQGSTSIDVGVHGTLAIQGSGSVLIQRTRPFSFGKLFDTVQVNLGRLTIDIFGEAVTVADDWTFSLDGTMTSAGNTFSVPGGIDLPAYPQFKLGNSSTPYRLNASAGEISMSIHLPSDDRQFNMGFLSFDASGQISSSGQFSFGGTTELDFTFFGNGFSGLITPTVSDTGITAAVSGSAVLLGIPVAGGGLSAELTETGCLTLTGGGATQSFQLPAGGPCGASRPQPSGAGVEGLLRAPSAGQPVVEPKPDSRSRVSARDEPLPDQARRRKHGPEPSIAHDVRRQRPVHELEMFDHSLDERAVDLLLLEPQQLFDVIDELSLPERD